MRFYLLCTSHRTVCSFAGGFPSARRVRSAQCRRQSRCVHSGQPWASGLCSSSASARSWFWFGANGKAARNLTGTSWRLERQDRLGRALHLSPASRDTALRWNKPRMPESPAESRRPGTCEESGRNSECVPQSTQVSVSRGWGPGGSAPEHQAWQTPLRGALQPPPGRPQPTRPQWPHSGGQILLCKSKHVV